ncbi:MAG: zinc-dependent metalloprotease [Armatimonadetes bacterium]|nr:zinc-dependent metalloprotease [Armatimonadota bacterium]
MTIKGKEGLFGRYNSETTINVEAGGQKVAILSKETAKVTVSKVEADGSVTFERKSESSEQSINGEKMPDDGKHPTTTQKVKADGTLVSLVGDSGDEDPEHLEVRIFLAQSPIFSEKPVGVNDTWKHSYAVNGTLGSKAAEATFKLISFENVGTAKCAKIQMDYHETGASPSLTSKVTMWVEVASGDVVKDEYQFDNVPFPGPTGANVMAQAKGTGQRTAGGPVPESGPQAAAEPEPKKIEDVTKGCQKIEGLFTLYRKREAGRQTIYMEIPKAQMDRLLMLEATVSTGNAKQLVTGTPLGDLLFKFSEFQPDRVTIVVPNVTMRADPGTELATAVRRSFADSFLEQFNVEARSKERGSVLIDVSDLFRGDIARLSAAFQSGPLMMGGGVSLDREKTFVSDLKSFPDNTVVETIYNLAGSNAQSLESLLSGTDSRSQVVKVVYNLFPLNVANGYVPRVYDSRIGYFTVWFQDFSRQKDFDQQTQYIVRWKMEKKDPNAALSEPVKPIVFWLDNAIPQAYRDPMRTGILTWNKAFEAIGIKDAIQVKQMPDDADWDPSDMRYNTIRWVASTSDAYAVSQFRNNPVTGEIINGNILVDANLVRFLTYERDSTVEPASDKARTLDPRSCRLVQDGLRQAQFGYLAATALGLPGNKVSSDEYVRQFLHNVICHEFGHMLGLRHNFVASTQLNLTQLGEKGLVDGDQPSASVMDYVPFNVSAIGKDGIDYYGQGLGKYDLWAISYGYSAFGAHEPKQESSDLAKIAKRCNEPGLQYQTDDVADGYDPYVTRFDLSAKPLDYWTRIMDLSKSLMATLGSRKPANGESYYEFTKQFTLLFNMQAKSAMELTRFVGGLRRSANLRGDAGEKPPLAPIADKEQASALEAVCKAVLAPDAIKLPKSYLVKLADDPNANVVEQMLGGRNTFPVLDWVTGVQEGILDELLSPSRLSLVANNEFKAALPTQSVSVGSVFQRVRESVWSELVTGSAVPATRRDLQRHHLDLLIRYANKTPASLPSDGQMWAWDDLRKLRAALVSAKPRATDNTTQVHLEQCLMKVDRALAAQETIGSSTGRPSLSDLLGGG